MKLISNSSGFSLIEMMITLSILALANMYAIEVGNNQLKQSRDITFHTDLTGFERQLQMLLGDPDDCDVNFGRASGHPLWFDLSQIDSATGHEYQHLFPTLGIVQKKRVPASDPSQPAHWEAGSQIFGISPSLNPAVRGLVTPALRISNPLLTKFVGGPINANEPTTRYQATLQFTAEKNDAQGLKGRISYGAQSLRREIHLNFLVDRATQTVISCNAAGNNSGSDFGAIGAGSAKFCSPGMFQTGITATGAPICTPWVVFQGPGAFGDQDHKDCETCWGGRLNWIHTCPDETPWVVRFGQRKNAPGRELYLKCGGPDGAVQELTWQIGDLAHRGIDSIRRDSEWGYSQPWDVGCDNPGDWMFGARQDGNGEVRAICRTIDPNTGKPNGVFHFPDQTSRMGRAVEQTDHMHWGPRRDYNLICPPNSVLAGFKQTEGRDSVQAYVICRGPKPEIDPVNGDDHL